MRRLLSCANRLILECDWKDMALLKLSLCALGVLIGVSLPVKKKKAPLLIAACAFLGTYIPLMIKIVPAFCRIWREEEV